MREYEIAVIYHPDLEIDLDKASKKVEKVFSDHKAKIEKTDNWGKRKLAYPIAKKDSGIYVFYRVSIPPENVAKLDQNLNITTEVIRHLIVKPGPEVVKAPEKVEQEDSNNKEGESDGKEL